MEKKASLSRIISIAGGFLFGTLCTLSVDVYGAGETSADYIAIPPFIAQTTDKPNVIINLDTSGSMKQPAYGQPGKSWSKDTHDNFDPTTTYYGYFEPTKFYVYDTDPAKLFFTEDPVSPSTKTADNWDGNFLNWLTMRRFDVVRKVLIGGKVRDRNTESIGSDDWYVLLGQNEPEDRQFYKSYSASSSYTPSKYADGTVFEIANGKVIPTTASAGGNVQAIVVQDTSGKSVEVGHVTMDWQLSDPQWVDVSFVNSYATPPVVVAKPLTFNGGDPTIVRVKNVTSTGFQIRPQEWDYKDGNHTTEQLFYMVADPGNYHIALSGSTNMTIEAGKISGMSTMCGTSTPANTVTQSLTPFLTTPLVFSAVSTFNEADAVVTRHENVGTSGFDVCLQEEESKTVVSDTHAAEDLHYIAIAPNSASTTLPFANVTGTNAQIEIGDSGGINVTDSWKTLTFATTFGEPPTVIMDIQTWEGYNTSSLRVADKIWTTTQIDVKIEEEQSDDSETDHVDEKVAYIAVSGASTYNIKLGIKETDTVDKPSEPKGLLQALEGGMRLGLAVFNYNHNLSPTSIYNTSGKNFDGGTFSPCYPDVLKPVSQRTNWDICKETYVGAPLDDLIDVIEDHPLVWATTPIAETLYNIGQTVAQGKAKTGAGGWSDLNSNPWPVSEARQGYPTAPSPNHNPLYKDNDGSTAHPNSGSHPPFKIHNDWDPYYYSSASGTLPCAKTFVLNFNDGEPYTDWDTANGFTVPADFVGDGDTKYGQNEALDDVALMFRNKDIRDDLTGHQEIISYYVLAALGSDPSDVPASARRRLMEAAVNGGFEDKDNNHMPDVAHPADIVSYISSHDDNSDLNDGGDCSTLTNEWDQDGDCMPDTFYFANDGYKLEQELLAAFQSILKRVASGSAASVLAGSTKGEGAIYQARFEQERTNGAYTVNWIGDITATFIDSAGRLREDSNADQVLDLDTSVDEIIDMCYNTTDQEVRVKTSDDPANRPTSAQSTACNKSTFNDDLFTVKYLWSAGKWLHDLTNAQVLVQRPYTSLSGRHILTAVDGSDATARDGVINGSEQQAFVDSTFSGIEGLLSATTSTEADEIVDFTRGSNAVSGYRSRDIDVGGTIKTWRLGDIIHSSPIALAAPAEDYHFIYAGNSLGDSYRSFVVEYLDRRTVVYAGANDGMLHAFNGGLYDQPTRKYNNGASGDTQYALGTELWAYIPYNMLPHLKYLSTPSYGSQDGDHLYMIDAEPRIFDARIFNDSATSTSGGIDGQTGVSHPNGWGTILVGSMRFGGGPVAVDIDNDGSSDQTLSSSFFILDITDPESPPQVLFEYTMADLGFTMATPTPIRKIISGTEQWYLLLGSGPHDASTPPTGLRDATSSQHARLMLLNLKTMSLETSFDSDGILVLDGTDDATNAFVSGMLPVDYNLDVETDAVYISTVNGTTGNFGGKLYRLTLRNSDGTGAVNSGSYKDIASWTVDIMLDDVKPVSAIANAGVDSNGNRWVFVGTGRFYVRNDATDGAQQAYYGVKEPRDSTLGGFTWGAVDKTDLVDVTSIAVDTNGDLTPSVDTKSGDGTVDTFAELNAAMIKPPSSGFTDVNHGWFRNLGQSPQTIYERNIGQAALLGGILAFTTFEPSGDICEYEGSSNLYALNFTTGTASPNASMFGAKGTPSSPVTLDEVVDLGEGLVATISLHTSPGYKDNSHSNTGDPTGDDSTKSTTTDTLGAVAVSSTGEAIQTELQSEGAVTSGESNWRFAY